MFFLYKIFILFKNNFNKFFLSYYLYSRVALRRYYVMSEGTN